MRVKRILEQPYWVNLLIALMVSIVIIIIYMTGFLRAYENSFSDYLMRKFIDQSKAGSKIVYVMTSERCFREAEQLYNMGWPWKRSAYGKVVEYLHLSGAKLIVFNSLFFDKSVYRNLDFDDDQLFAKKIRDAGNVIIGYQFRLPLKKSRRSTDDQIENRLLKGFSLKIHGDKTLSRIPESYKAHMPLKKLSESVLSIGYGNSYPDEDGVFRRGYVLVKYFDQFYGSLGLITALNYLDIKKLAIENGNLYLDNRVVPLDENGLMRIKYYGTNDVYHDYYQIDILKVYQYIHELYQKYVTLSDVEPIEYQKLFRHHSEILKLKEILREKYPKLVSKISAKIIQKVPPEAFKDKIVLLGSIATGDYPQTPTPFKSDEAGIHIYASMIDNFINNDFLYEFRENGMMVLLLIILSLVTGYITGQFEIIQCSLINFFLMAIIFVTTIIVLMTQNVIIDALTLMFTIFTTFLAVMIVKQRNTYLAKLQYANQLADKNEEIVRLNSRIHDSIKNKLNSVQEQIGLYKRGVPNSLGDENSRLEIISKLITHCSNESKNILFSTKYPDCSIKRLIQELEVRAELSIKLYGINYRIMSNEFPEEFIFKSHLSNYLLDAYSEILNNIVKHSMAQMVEITLNYETNYILFNVKDNGIGFDSEKALQECHTKMGSYGLPILLRLTEEIGGKIEFSENKPSGVVVTINVPMIR